MFKCTLSTSMLIATLKEAAPFLDKKSVIPILHHVKITPKPDGFLLTVTDLDRSYERALKGTAVTFKKGREISRAMGSPLTVDLKALQTALSGMTGITVTLEFLETYCQTIAQKPLSPQVKVTSGKRSAVLETMYGVDFPEISFDRETSTTPKTISIPRTLMSEIFTRLKPCMSLDDTRYYLAGILFHFIKGKLWCVATDGHKVIKHPLSFEILKGEFPDDFQMIMPSGTINALMSILKNGPAYVTMDIVSAGDTDESSEKSPNSRKYGHKLQVSFWDRVIISKCVDGAYPDYDRVIPHESENDFVNFSVDRSELQSTFDWFKKSSGGKSGKTKVSKPNGHIKIETDEHDTAHYEARIKASGDDTDMIWALNPFYMADLLKHIHGDSVTVSISDPRQPLLIKGSDDPATTAIMPMKV